MAFGDGAVATVGDDACAGLARRAGNNRCLLVFRYRHCGRYWAVCRQNWGAQKKDRRAKRNAVRPWV